ncbi:hypothetical protein HMI55_001219 [Coelomomyces lativittatus]|nr:hypothetical protein HMI55_001219 [Coelomomyces lativittatus]
MLKYKAILAFFLLLSLNSSFLLAEDDSDAESPVVLDDTVSKQTVTSDDVKVDPLSLRPRGKWTVRCSWIFIYLKKKKKKKGRKSLVSPLFRFFFSPLLFHFIF